ncbi:GTP cyclohydrolase II [mine drainage metagenome]|uniref:GTP cyclohydrolase II n=1 Tax=mine drainage metagenome TaxID=410659 RepID=T0Z1J4_9ZZZZ
MKQRTRRFVINGKAITVSDKSSGYIENKYGQFYLHYVDVNDEWGTYLVLVKARRYSDYMPIFGNDEVYLRIDSGCATGYIFDDATCDCRLQLEHAMSMIAKNGSGMVIMSEAQDGRGFGLEFKLKTLTAIKDLGIDTVSAFNRVSKSGKADRRTYEGTIAIMKLFGIKSGNKVVLLTNNPDKIGMLRDHGFNVSYKAYHPRIRNRLLAINMKGKREKLGYREG